eukprot:SM000064S19784  [mRNA]  locus=s64:511766:514413:+ [translate_table: standard]
MQDASRFCSAACSTASAVYAAQLPPAREGLLGADELAAAVCDVKAGLLESSGAALLESSVELAALTQAGGEAEGASADRHGLPGRGAGEDGQLQVSERGPSSSPDWPTDATQAPPGPAGAVEGYVPQRSHGAAGTWEASQTLWRGRYMVNVHPARQPAVSEPAGASSPLQLPADCPASLDDIGAEVGGAAAVSGGSMAAGVVGDQASVGSEGSGDEEGSWPRSRDSLEIARVRTRRTGDRVTGGSRSSSISTLSDQHVTSTLSPTAPSGTGTPRSALSSVHGSPAGSTARLSRRVSWADEMGQELLCIQAAGTANAAGNGDASVARDSRPGTPALRSLSSCSKDAASRRRLAHTDTAHAKSSHHNAEDKDERLASAEAMAEALACAAAAVEAGEVDCSLAASIMGVAIQAAGQPPACSGEESAADDEATDETDNDEDDDGWLDQPPAGFWSKLSPFGSLWMALEGWISAASIAFFYKRPQSGDAWLELGGREYGPRTVLRDGTSAGIAKTFAECVGRSLPEVQQALRLSVSNSALQQATVSPFQIFCFTCPSFTKFSDEHIPMWSSIDFRPYSRYQTLVWTSKTGLPDSRFRTLRENKRLSVTHGVLLADAMQSKAVVTMSFMDPLPAFSRKQWQIVTLLLNEALSVEQLPGLEHQLKLNAKHALKLVAEAGLSEEEYLVLRSLPLPCPTSSLSF